MFLLISLLAFLMVSGPLAYAADGAVGPAPDAAEKGPDTSALTEGRDKKKEEMTAAEAEAERKRKEKLARVIVLKWINTSTDHRDDTVQRNVKSRIARPEAQFFPEVDLYQKGRQVPDTTVVPAMQPAVVPNQNVQRVRQAVDSVSSIAYNQISSDQWGLKANELKSMIDFIWFIDRVDLREPLFLLYAQLGRCAENMSANVTPFYEVVGNQPVNFYYYQAAVLAFQDPSLLSKLNDQELNGNVTAILQLLQQGAFPNLKLDFELESEKFDLETFGSEYTVLLNGIETELNDQGQYDIFLGRTDIYMRRNDSGHGLSERLEVAKLVDRVYFVRENARKRMGYDFIEQLFLHPNECTPALDGDILTYLAIYAKIHEKAEIYIAVPKDGNPNRVWVWRYDRQTATLQLVGGGNDGFPVRFAILAAGGVMYNTLTVQYSLPDGQDAVNTANGGFITSADINGDAFLPSADAEPVMFPINLELRGHYNRLMMAFGSEFGVNLNDDDKPWVERYYTHGKDPDEVTVTTDDCAANGAVPCPEVFNYVKANRYLYTSIGIVLGRDAGIGFGPRFATRVGWTNVPHAVQWTGHAGWTFDMPVVGNLGERVRPFLDLDGRIGGVFPLSNSLTLDGTDKYIDSIGLVFGIVGGIGTTF